MSVKRLTVGLERLSTQLWQAAIKFEKMSTLAGDLQAVSDSLKVDYGDKFERQNFAQRQIREKLRALSWEISGLDAKVQELAWSVDPITDLLEEFSH